jgi:hypothetical protein
MVDHLERLAEAGALARRERDAEVASLVGERLAPPDAAADLDRLAGGADRRVERHPVEALDHLRA